MDLTTTIVKGYDLSGGAANWTSADLSDFTNYYLDFIWSNVTGTLDGSLLIRQTSDSIVYESIETFTINSKDETRLKNNIGLSEDKINVKFTPNSITGGRLTIKLRAIESNLQAHKSNDSIHFTEESIDHANIQNIGANSHSEIDTHIALTNEHIDWTDATENLSTTGIGNFGQSIVISKDDVGCNLEIGQTNTNQFALLDLKGDSTYTDYGLRIIRGGGGANSASQLQHRGTGALRFHTQEAADIEFFTTNALRMTIESGGNVEMFSDLLFIGAGSGLPCGEIYVNDNTTVTSVSNAGFTQFLYFDTNGHANLTTPDHTNDHILIDTAGVYMIDCCVNIKNSSGAAHDIEVVIAKNNGSTIFPNMRRHRTLGTGTDVGAIPICGHLGLEINDTIEVWITSDSGAARDVTAEDVVLMLTMVGGN